MFIDHGRRNSPSMILAFLADNWGEPHPEHLRPRPPATAPVPYSSSPGVRRPRFVSARAFLSRSRRSRAEREGRGRFPRRRVGLQRGRSSIELEPAAGGLAIPPLRSRLVDDDHHDPAPDAAGRFVSLSSSSKATDVAGSKRSSARVADRLACCPPGPPVARESPVQLPSPRIENGRRHADLPWADGTPTLRNVDIEETHPP